MVEASEDLSKKLKRLTLNGIQPLTNIRLGRGAYAQVYAVKYRDVTCAAKEIHPILLEDDKTEKFRENFERECIRCSELVHPNIVDFVGVYYPKQAPLPVMVMELMDESLTKYVEKPNISLKRKISILHDAAEGLTYLHTRNPPVIHRDLSPNNVLLKNMPLLPVAKIADLGVAKGIDVDRWSAIEYLSQAPGTIPFMPPEALKDKPKYGLSLDIFSFGGVVLYTVTGQWPTPIPPTEFDPVTRQTKGLNEVERRKKYLDQLTGEAEVLRPLVEACLDNDPAMRPPISHLSEKIKPLKESPPLMPALKSGCYEVTWERCADLPSPMYNISAVHHDKKVYAMAGDALDYDTYKHVYCYSIVIDQWEQIPSPGHHMGRLQIIDGKLTVIGGVDTDTNSITNKVSTLINKSWTNHYPNLIRARTKPGVVSHLHYVIVVGGYRDTSDSIINDDIEVLDTTKASQWMMANILLPEPVYEIFPIVSDNKFYIVGFTSDLTYTTACQLSVDIITSSITTHLTSDNPVQWMQSPAAPHYFTRAIPNSHPPVIMGGSDLQGALTSDIAMLDEASSTWKRVSLLSSPRKHVSVVPIDSDTILVLGGCTGGEGVAGALQHSITTAEKGRATLIQKTAATHQNIGSSDQNSNLCTIL